MHNETQIDIDPEFKNLLQPLPEEDYRGLEEDIEKRGCLNPIIIWNKIVVDGHNRFQICNKLGIECAVKEIQFEDREEAKLWIIQHQLKRRNLNDFQRCELALRMKEIISQKAKENQRAGGGSVRMKSDKPVDTLEEMAQIAGVCKDTFFKAEKVIEKVPEEVKERLRIGETKIHSVYSKLKAQEKPVEHDSDPQEKLLVTLVDGIELKIMKLEKAKNSISASLKEKLQGRLIPLGHKIHSLYSDQL